MLSLTIVRMLPVAIAMLGSGAQRQTVAFLGWFGPRGLASIVFAVIVVQEAHLAGAPTILLAAYLTVGLSVFAHGVTAAPLAGRYARWYEGAATSGDRRWRASRSRTTGRAGLMTPARRRRAPAPPSCAGPRPGRRRLAPPLSSESPASLPERRRAGARRITSSG